MVAAVTMRRLAILALVGGAVIALVLVGYALAQVDSQDDQLDTFFLAGREEFSICLDSVDGDPVTDSAVNALREAVTDAIGGTSAFVPEQYNAPEFEIGCPPPTIMDLDVQTYDERNTIRDRAQIIGDPLGPSAPSRHRLFVYLVEPSRYAATFGSEPYVTSGEEFICDGICHSVTRALFISEETGLAAQTIRTGLLATLGLLTEAEVLELFGYGGSN